MPRRLPPLVGLQWTLLFLMALAARSRQLLTDEDCQVPPAPPYLYEMEAFALIREAAVDEAVQQSNDAAPLEGGLLQTQVEFTKLTVPLHHRDWRQKHVIGPLAQRAAEFSALRGHRSAVHSAFALGIICGATLCAVTAVLLLLVKSRCDFVDVFSLCRQCMRFRSCRAKVRRVHEDFGRNAALPLICPYCVDNLPPHRSPDSVVFICGHRFHAECARSWAGERPGRAEGGCPICSGQETGRAAARPRAGSDEEPPGDNGLDEAKAFISGSLHRQFPEFVPEACVKRWAASHTETWVSELRFVRWPASPCSTGCLCMPKLLDV